MSRSGTKGQLLATVLLLTGTLISISWSLYFAGVTILIPYQIEFREGAAQIMTGFLRNGNNPFVLENQPLGMNNYGLGYHLVVVPFATVFGNTLAVHRSVTFAFILLCSLAAGSAVYKIRKEPAPTLACAAFIMIGLIARAGIGAFPSAMGTFLFLLTILIPFVRAFDRDSLLLSLVLSLAAFYTKPYFVLGFGIVASYVFLFVSKKAGLLYTAGFLALFAISFLGMRLAFPLYFINTVMSNLSNVERSSAHLFSQLKQLLIFFLPVLLLSLLLLRSQKGSSARVGDHALHLSAWPPPLIGASPNYFLYASSCALLAFILFLGAHIGNYLTYAYQLVIPVFFCWFFLTLDLQKKNGWLIAVAILFNLFFWGANALSPKMLEQKNSSEWASLYSYLSSSSSILNSPVITSALVEQGLSPLDSGQTSYFYSIPPYPDIAILGPPYETLRADGLKYVRFVDSSIEKQKFDLLVTTREKGMFYHMKLAREFYAPIAEIEIGMPQSGQQWTVLIWKPLVR